MNSSRRLLDCIYGAIGGIFLISATPALGSLASTYCNGLLGGDDPVFSSCSDSNTYTAAGNTLTQNGDALANLSTGQIHTVASGDRYFSLGYAGTASGLLQDVVTVQGPGSNWSANIQMTMTIDGVVTGPLQNTPNLVADSYLYGTSIETNSANVYVFWDGTAFTTITTGSEGNYSVNVLASGTNNYSVVLTNSFAVSSQNPNIYFSAYLLATGGSQTTGTVVSDFGNTAQLNIILPAGYSFTSESGVFLSEIPVPPPPTSGSVFMPWLPVLLEDNN
jgi:hypothetical protein